MNKGIRVVVKCEICCKEVTVYPYLGRKQRFCSKSCALVARERKTTTYALISKSLVGRKLSEEHKEKLRQAKLGKHLSESHRESLCKSAKRGENNHKWKGGITSDDKKLRIKFNKTLRKIVLFRDNYTCCLCGVVGGKLMVDHIKPWAEFPYLRFDISNCRTLCDRCHYFVTFGHTMPVNVKNWGINLGGNSI